MITDSALRRVEAQGFTDLDEARARALDPWLRVAPAVYLLGAGFGTLTGSVPVLAALVPFAVAGAVLPVHPLDVLHALLRGVTGAPAIPGHPAPRRFACLLAALLLEATTWAFAAGHAPLGRTLGSVLAFAALLNLATGLSPGAWIYARIFGTPIPTGQPVR